MSRLTARIQARRLRMRCTIARAAVTGTDTYGADTLADPTPVLADLPCWYRAASGGGEQFTPPRDVVIDPA
ncbi:MAG: hypothetical protein ACTHMP_26360, partial [Thermomicrobiales bacterium]